MYLLKDKLKYSRFDDDCQSISPFSVQKPVYQVSRHLGSVGVEVEESDVVACNNEKY